MDLISFAFFFVSPFFRGAVPFSVLHIWERLQKKRTIINDKVQKWSIMRCLLFTGSWARVCAPCFLASLVWMGLMIAHHGHHGRREKQVQPLRLLAAQKRCGYAISGAWSKFLSMNLQRFWRAEPAVPDDTAAAKLWMKWHNNVVLS